VMFLSRETKDNEGKDDSCEHYQANVEHPPSLLSPAFLALISPSVLCTHSLTKLRVVHGNLHSMLQDSEAYHSRV
jgi:hypothetical protein